MEFYTAIHPWYDQIFPYSEAQRDFVLSYGDNPALSVADVGCGTGSLIVSLGKVFRKTVGLDPDKSMLEAARHKATIAKAGTWFAEAGMLDLTRELASQSVDRLICFGNTLPHLASEEEVGQFVQQVSRILKPDGLVLIQIINYDRILDQKLNGLPTIENNEFRFDRSYQYAENPTHVQFQTRLTLKATGVVITNEVPLFALRPAQLHKILDKSGFGNIEEFGSFGKATLTKESQPYILKARVNS